METDARGFTIFGHVVDHAGNTISVKESSSAEANRVWVFIEESNTTQAVELNRDQVDSLVSMLQAWQHMDNGSADL